MRKSDEVIAVLCADLHLSSNPPIARAGEHSWWSAMDRALNELHKAAKEYNAPILCAGDVFDHWKASPELINFCLDCLPEMYAVPGQHDLPLHSMENIHQSAYWTMVKVGRIKNVHYSQVITLQLRPRVCLYGFGWGVEPSAPTPHGGGDVLNIALVHEYTWVKGFGYPGAPKKSKADLKKYQGFDVVAVGDNHIPFMLDSNPVLWNCGSLMRRNSDQTGHKPRLGLLHANGTVTSHYLDISQDVFTPIEAARVNTVGGLEKFIEQLQGLQAATLDYRKALERAVQDQPQPVRQIILEALDRGNTH